MNDTLELIDELTTGDFEPDRSSKHWGTVGVISLVTRAEYAAAMAHLVCSFQFDVDWMETCHLSTPPGDHPMLLQADGGSLLMRRLSEDELARVIEQRGAHNDS